MIGPNDYRHILSRSGKEVAVRTGGTQPCPKEGCNGTRVYVRWPDNRITAPCTKGLVRRPDGRYQIG